MSKSFFALLALSCLLVMAGCSAATAAPASANRATPTSAPTDTPPPTPPPSPTALPSPTPGPLPDCPQLPAAASGAAPAAPLSLYASALDANDDAGALNASNGSQRWKEPIAFPGDRWTLMAVEQNVLYAVLLQENRGGYAEALNASDGRLRWCTPVLHRVPATEGFDSPQLAIDADTVYVGDGLYGIITALRASDGKRLWQTQAEGGILSLTAADGQVYASSEAVTGQDTFSAFDASTGKERWHVQTGNGVFFTPAVAAGVVYVAESRPNYPGILYALNASNGSQRWHREGNFDYGGLVVVNGTIYGTESDGVFALNASSGAQRWHVQPPASLGLTAVANGVVYVGGFSGSDNLGIVYALDASTGAQRWHSAEFPRAALAASAAPGMSALTSGPDAVVFLSVVDGVVYASTFGTSAALNASTGKIFWHVSAQTLAIG